MSKRLFIGSWTAMVIGGLIFATAAVAAAPVVNEHANLTSDPYADNWCGIDGISVDRVVAHYKEDESGASITNLNIRTLFTATESGKSIEIRSIGLRTASAPIDNGNGTYSLTASNRGQAPGIKLPNGPVIVLSVGLIEFLATFDSATGDFLSFEVTRETGQHLPGCALIVAALT